MSDIGLNIAVALVSAHLLKDFLVSANGHPRQPCLQRRHRLLPKHPASKEKQPILQQPAEQGHRKCERKWRARSCECKVRVVGVEQKQQDWARRDKRWSKRITDLAQDEYRSKRY